MIVSGQVTDHTGTPIFNASVVVQNSIPLQGTTTDFNGNYSINTNANSILEFSHVGSFQKIVKNVANQNKIDIAMMNEIPLNEVQVNGNKSNKCGVLCLLLAGFLSYKTYTYFTKKPKKVIL